MKALTLTLKTLRRLGQAGAVVFPALLVAVFLAGWWFGRPVSKPATVAGTGDSGIVWTCSMHPTVRQPGPGVCPTCEMDLIAVSSDSGGGLRDIKLTRDAVARLDIRVAPVVSQPATHRLEFLGRVSPNERNVAATTARMDGRLDRLYVDYTGIPVRENDHLAEIYSPDLYVAQDELIQARRNLAGSPDRTRQALYRASREKLRLLGIAPEQLDLIERQAAPTDHITLTAPQDGVVLKLHKREGDYVKTGEAIYTLADLSSVWVILEAYEGDLPWLRFAQKVEFHAEAIPGRSFTGRIAFIDPILDETRRIARIRVNVPNPDRALKPGMFIRGEVHSVLIGGRVLAPDLVGKWISPMHPEIVKDEPGQCDICGMDLVPAAELGYASSPDDAVMPLLVPASAVLRTGKRAVVYRRILSEDAPVFEGREIILGPRAGDYFIVESGLREGDLVVTRGAFKLDSELQIRARPAMMLDGRSIGESSAADAPKTVSGAWKPVLRSLARAGQALESKDAFLTHLNTARHLLSEIKPKFLADDYKPLWHEASMKLENLFAATGLTATKETPVEAWEELLRALPKDAALAGLDWNLPELEVFPEKQLAELRIVIDAYLPVADFLAHDKPDEALAKAEPLADALRKTSVPAVSRTADSLLEASDEATLRTTLKEVTNALATAIREGGLDQLGPLYLVHCPMAFKNAGADWLSRIPEVENPYYGAKMFSCGDVIETLSVQNK